MLAGLTAEDLLVTVAEAAGIHHISRAEAYRRIAGRFPRSHSSTQYPRYRYGDLADLLEQTPPGIS